MQLSKSAPFVMSQPALTPFPGQWQPPPHDGYVHPSKQPKCGVLTGGCKQRAKRAIFLSLGGKIKIWKLIIDESVKVKESSSQNVRTLFTTTAAIRRIIGSKPDVSLRQNFREVATELRGYGVVIIPTWIEGWITNPAGPDFWRVHVWRDVWLPACWR